MNSFLLSTTLFLLLLSGLPAPAEAAPAHFKKPVSSAHVKKLRQRSIKRTQRKLERLTQRLDGMNTLAKDFSDRGVANLKVTEKATFDMLTQQQNKLLAKLVTLKKQSVAEYAAERGIELIPAPPAGPPPPLPPTTPTVAGQLQVPQPTTQPVRSFLPPGGSTKVTVDRSTDF